jgi:hypothetical protein
METERLPWLFAALTAAWFGWMAHRADRTSVLWAVGGGAFGLVVSTLMLGLGHASSIPFSAQDRTNIQIKWILVAAAIIGAIGWLLTASLHRHYLRARERLAADAGQPGPVAPAPMPKPAVPDQLPPGKPTA